MKTHLLAGSLAVSAALLQFTFAAAPSPPITVTETAADSATPNTPKVLEAFTVTGSHVKRVDFETPSPVLTFSLESIEEKGYATLGEFIQSLSFNNNQTNSEVTGGSFITGAATSNPRGLGSNRFLSLINGRRAVPYALTNGINGTPASAFNFNSVPSAAIERVEFLKDGASAIYGSDAITGVYNIILKKNYTGSAVDFSVSNTLGHDTLNRRVSVTHGVAKDGVQISVAVNHQSRHSNFIQDFGTKSTDYSYLGPKGQAIFSFLNVPSPIFLSATQATTAGLGPAGWYVIPGGVPTTNPTRTSFVYAGPTTAAIPGANRLDFAQDQQFQPASELTGGFASIERRLTTNLSTFAQIFHTHSRTYYEFTPSGYSTSLNGLPLSAANPYNPFGFALTNSGTAYSFAASTRGFRPKREADNNTTTALAGLRGTAFSIWNWETGVSYGMDRTRRATDLIRVEDMRAALSGTTRATAFNPFGPSDNPNLVPGLHTRAFERDNFVDSASFDLSASAKPWQIPLPSAGELGIATGLEYRADYLRGRPDSGSYINFTNNQPFQGRRHLHSVYVELSVPLQKWLELQFAGRHENYSDFGTTTKPKYSAKLNLPRNTFVNVLLRGSYSESFKAPDLGQAYQGQAIAFTNVSDPLRPQDGVRSVMVVQGGNPALNPEEGKVQYSGFVFEFPRVRGLSLTADYLDIKIRNVIGTLSVAYLLSPEGLKQFPNAVVRDNSVQNPGPIRSFSGIPENLGFQLFRGWDFGLRYSVRTQRRGVFNFSADVTQTVKRGTNAGLGGGFANNTGRYNAPVWRSNLAVNWRYQTVSAAISADVIGKLHNRSWTAVGWGENVFPIISPSFTYRGFRRTTVTLGANNVFNHRSPPNGYDILGFDDRAITVIGANGIILHLRVRREF